MRGPKRASKIRKLFTSPRRMRSGSTSIHTLEPTQQNLGRRSVKLQRQRLVTPLTLQRKRARIAEKKKRILKAKAKAAEYHKLLASRLKEQRERRSESLTKRRSKLSSASKPSIVA